MKPILVTGAAGFIGFSLSQRLLKEGHKVVGIDNLNSYYDVSLKKARLQILKKSSSFHFEKIDIIDAKKTMKVFATHKFNQVVHLAAQAGVRYSVTHPHAYIETNIQGFLNILEACRYQKAKHLIYASTSSVYGLSTKMPFSPHEDADHPVSLYASTKRANELMAHSYSHLYQLPTTGLRFFTVYGPWGRPDMALFLFTKNILEGKPIEVFNKGQHSRDFTYVDDIVEGLFRVATGKAPAANPQWDSSQPDPATSSAPFRIYNIGNNRSVPLMRYIELLEGNLKKKAKKKFLPMQMGDIASTQANVDDLMKDFGYRPNTPIEVGVSNFVKWYRDYFQV